MPREIRQPRTNIARAKREKSLRRVRILRLEHLERRACPAVVAAPQSVSILEGKSRDVAFRLDQAPIAAVTFTVESSNPTQFAIEPSALTFTPENWRVRQVVRVAGVQDFIKDGRAVGSLITGRVSSDDERYAREEVRDVAITVQDSRVDLLQFQGAYTGSVTGRGDVSGTVRFVVTGRNVTAEMVVTAPAIDLDERSLIGSGTIDPSGRVNVVSNDLDAPVRFSGRVVVGKTGTRVVNAGSWQYGGNTSGKWQADSPPQQVADDPFAYTPLFAMGVPETSGAPGVAGAVYLKKGNRQEIFAAGQRGVNPATNKNAGPVSANDIWHLGSNTKAITCTLLGTMIQNGTSLPDAQNPAQSDPSRKLDWDTPLTDVFPEWRKEMQDKGLLQRFQGTTLRHLAGHRSGLAMTAAEDAETRVLGGKNNDPPTFRLEMTHRLLTRQHYNDPNDTSSGVSMPGGIYNYGNPNYIVLPAVIERLTGAAFEDAMLYWLGANLDIDSAGFGMPTDGEGALKQPHGHLIDNASPYGIKPDNGPLPPIWNGSGGLYMTLQDHLKFLRLHLNGTEGSLTLQPKTLAELHTPMVGPDASGTVRRYAWGWGVSVDGKVLSHDGTYHRFYASTHVYLEKGFAVTGVANVGDREWGNPYGEVSATVSADGKSLDIEKSAYPSIIKDKVLAVKLQPRIWLPGTDDVIDTAKITSWKDALVPFSTVKVNLDAALPDDYRGQAVKVRLPAPWATIRGSEAAGAVRRELVSQALLATGGA